MDMHPTFHIYLYGPDQGPIETSFEAAESRLSELPRLHFEPDGSFVWALDGGQQQLFGMIYDAHGSIQYCEVRGHCDLTTWRQLCNAINDECEIPLEVLKLPDRQRQDLQSFEQTVWADSDQP
jgi:hypothetical protein